MRWYEKYLNIYEKEFSLVDYEIIDSIRSKYRALNESNNPLASVVVIAHNEASRIAACLWSLCDNACIYPFEILVVDNNSTDTTVEVLNSLGISWYEETNKGPGFARNKGLQYARGKYYICADSDSIYPSQYIETYIRILSRESVVCCYGLWSFIPDAKHSSFQLLIYEFLRDAYLRVQNIKRPELNVRGMTFAFHTDLGKKIKFRTDIIRGEDGSLALRMKDYGKLVLVTSRKTRIITDNNTMNADGSMYRSFMKRLYKACRNMFSLFRKKSAYLDEESNMLK
jgi:glycosyltransferase involved in cell wall biosynthesis